jgi:hypothetical protein
MKLWNKCLYLLALAIAFGVLCHRYAPTVIHVRLHFVDWLVIGPCDLLSLAIAGCAISVYKDLVNPVRRLIAKLFPGHTKAPAQSAQLTGLAQPPDDSLSAPPASVTPKSGFSLKKAKQIPGALGHGLVYTLHFLAHLTGRAFTLFAVLAIAMAGLAGGLSVYCPWVAIFLGICFALTVSPFGFETSLAQELFAVAAKFKSRKSRAPVAKASTVPSSAAAA